MARSGLVVPALLFALLAPGCGREGPGATAGSKLPQATPREGEAAAPASAATGSVSLKNVRRDWEVNRALPERKGVGLFESRSAEAPARRAARAAQEAAAAALAAPAAPPPPPYAYVGKVARGDIGYAVLTREERVFMVRAGDTLERYRVQSVNEKEVVLLATDTGTTHSLAFTAPAASGALLPTATAGGIDDVSLQVSAPSQVAVGDQFTLTVSLASGMNTVLDTGRVEVRFDPRVLEVPGQAAATGAAHMEITGAYPGHAAPATLQFRVVAAAPTATEIRVVPTSISDSDGRDVGVNTPQAHRLRIVRAAPAGG